MPRAVSGEQLIALIPLLLSLNSLVPVSLPAGSLLRVRMNTPVASWSSPVGTLISAAVIAPVIVDGHVVIPAGSTLSGRITSVSRVGFGIRHERASLGLEFSSVTLPDGQTSELSARVTEVDNARERVRSSGLIQGVRATSGISYRVSGYLKEILLWHFHAEIAEWAIKSLLVQLPEPEIYYPVGTELTLSLNKESLSVAPLRPTNSAEFSHSEFSDLVRLVSSMPSRTSDPESGRPSDVTNVLLVGSRSQVVAAFRTAGWELALPVSLRSRIGYIRAAAESRGYSGPMSSLLLDGEEADMCWQKGLNDVSKRHHIRVWKQPGSWNGQELWIAAATHDIDFAYLRPGRTFAHRIEENVDEEREKVAYDLSSTACASPAWWVDRPQVPHSGHNGTGDPFVTDARLAVVRFGDCSLTQPAAVDRAPLTLVSRGGKFQRFVRREILVTRSDLIRANPYWRMYEAARMSFDLARERKRNATSRSRLSDAPPMEYPRRWENLREALSSWQ